MSNRVLGLLAVVLGDVLAACRGAHDDSDRVGSPVIDVRPNGATESSTLSIPRYKIVQNPMISTELWLAVAVKSGPDTFHSTDGGETWQPIGAMGWEMHVSIAGGENGILHIINRGTPAASYHRLRGDTFDSAAARPFADFDELATSGNVAATGDEVVVFTRTPDNNALPIVYHRSTDQGSTWNAGSVAGTGNPSKGLHRIGSCVIDGAISLVYWRETGADGDVLEIHRWNGRSFEPLPHDFRTVTSSRWTRQFGITQDAQRRIQLVTWDIVAGQKVVRHSWRTLESAWNPPVTVVAWDNDEIHPQLAAIGDRLLLLYLYNPRSSRSRDAGVFYKLWSIETGWSPDGDRISNAGGAARYPVAPQRVDPASDFVPVVWTQGDAIRYTPLRLP